MTTATNLHLPKSSWTKLLSLVSDIALGKPVTIVEADQLFLQQLGYLEAVGLELTAEGANIARLLMVRNDLDAAADLTHQAIVQLPATQAVLQSLGGVDAIDVGQVEAAMVMAGLDRDAANKGVVNFLSVLNANGVVVYNRKRRSVKLLISSKEASAPSHIYVDKVRPYSNDLWIREIIRECRGGVLWLDKYFQKGAFEWLWREAEASKINHIYIVSTQNEDGIDPLAVADYRKLKKELAEKNITLEWRVLDRKDAYDLHDRWILDEVDLAYNVPSIHSIRSGQRSELHRSPNHEEVRRIFNEYFVKAALVK